MRFTPPPVSLRQLQYVVAVAEMRSFGKAAQLCCVSQPSLSAQIAEVEGILGVRLFERDQRRVLPTAAGRCLVEHARKVLDQLDHLVEGARRFVDPLTSTLRIGVIPTIGPYLLPRIVPALRGAYPQLKLVWVEDKNEPLLQQLRQGELDAALFGLLSPDVGLAGLDYDPVAEDPFLLATPAGHALTQSREPIALETLQGERLLLIEEGHCLRDQALTYCATAMLEELSFRATSMLTLTQMVSGGLGITLLPRLAATAERHRSTIAVRAFAAPAPARTLILAWRQGSPLADALRGIAAAIRAAPGEDEPL